MSEHNTDKSMSNEEIIRQVTYPEIADMDFTKEELFSAMDAARKDECAEKDKEIADLDIRNSYLWDVITIKESIIQELLSALEASNELLVKDSYGLERLESNYQLIQKHSITKSGNAG